MKKAQGEPTGPGCTSLAGRGPQPRTIESPRTEIASVGSGLFAGPFATEPSRLNLLPWHLQLIVPFATSDTVHPWCVQVADRPLKFPAVGWVTTMLPTITPDPTGTSDFFAIAPAAGLLSPPGFVP